MNNYRTLATEYYDLFSPRASEGEVEPFVELLKKNPGNHLEAMCGSGRLLLPLSEEGLTVDGFDYSPQMLASCSVRLPSVELYEGAIESIALPKTYHNIVVGTGSFQLIKCRDQALQALKNMRAQLAQGGQLILECWIPWHVIKSGEIAHEQDRKGAIVARSSSVIQIEEQLIDNTFIYEKWEDGELVARDEETIHLRWYYPHEMTLFLEKAGFTSIEVRPAPDPLVPNSTLYIARL